MSEMLEAKTTRFSVWMKPFRSTRKCAAFSVQKIPFKEFSCILKFKEFLIKDTNSINISKFCSWRG
ncbi:MAG TPA: hypothetical protein VJH65_02860 [Candidatus Nanoarchaeia archaeon]|nr:hypothetical protein [Candidatus Nanoarchaeia archaeon]